MSQGVLNPITHTEIKAWSTNTGTVVREEEVYMLLAMDEAYISASTLEQEAALARSQNAAPDSK